MLITNFSAGELSLKLSGRVDLPQYFAGASHLKNFEVIPTGGIERRKGFKRIGKLSGAGRIIPFLINKDLNFILIVTVGKTYIWRTDADFESENFQEINNPYQSLAEIRAVQYAQDYDTLIFVEKHHAPIQLAYDFTTRTFAANTMSFDFYPDVKLDDDYDYVMYGEELPVYSDTYSTEGNYIFTWYYYETQNGTSTRIDRTSTFKSLDLVLTVYNGQLFQYNKDSLLSNKWELYQQDPETDTNLFTTTSKYPSCVAFFNSRLWFAATENAMQKVWASAAPDTKGQRYNDFSTWQKYVTVDKVIKDADLHIFSADINAEDIDTVNDRTVLRNVTQNLTNLDRDITEYYVTQSSYVPVGTKIISATWDSSTNKGTVTLNKALPIEWNQETTTVVNGQGQLTTETTTETVKYAVVFTASLWVNSNAASAEDYDFKVVSNNVVTNDCSFSFEIASDQNDAIKWLGANNYLVIGSESSVWCVPDTVTALNILAQMNGRYGSDEIQAHCVDRAMIFFAQGKMGIREYYYDSQKEAFQTNNIAIHAEQMLTESPAIDFDFVTNPYNRLVITREDGTVVTLLYDKNNGVMAWNRIVHGLGKITSCAVTRGEAQADKLFYIVRIGDEYFLESYDENDEVYLDSWNEWTEDMEIEDYDENKAVLFNETQNKECQLNDVPEDFADEGDRVYIGYEFDSVISSMPVVLNDPTGKKRITSLLVRFLDSFAPVMTIPGLPDELFSAMAEPYSGIQKITYPGTSERDVSFTLSIDKPQRCNILAVNAVAV